MKKFKIKVLATVVLVAVASLFTVCSATGVGGGVSQGGSAKIWNVMFDADGGLPEPEAVTVADGGTLAGIDKFPEDPVKEPSDFGGWYFGETQFEGETPVNGDLTLRAKWSESKLQVYTVTFDGDSGSPATQSKSIREGGTVKPLPDVTRTGWTFGGWWTETDGGGTEFTSQTSVSGAVTVHAKWIAAADGGHFHVTFDGAGGDPATYIKENVSEGGKVAPLPAITRTGYIFGGWWTETDGGGTEFTVSTAVTSAITLYAKWTAVTYTVQYDANGGTGAMSSSTHTYNITKRLNALGFSKSGYAFRGWALSPDGQWMFDDNESVSNLAGTQGAVVPLYAVWLSASQDGGEGEDGDWISGAPGAPGWAEWVDAPVPSDPNDTTDPGGYTPGTGPSTWETISGADGGGIVTITFLSDTQYKVAGAISNDGTFTLATTGVSFASGFTGQIIVDGDGAAVRTPAVTITLDGVTISKTVSPLILQNGANVMLVLAAGKTNTLTATSDNNAGLNVPENNKITIIGSGALDVEGARAGAGIGGNRAGKGGTITIGGSAVITAISTERGAGIGGGGQYGDAGSYGGEGGTTTIGGNARVTATGGDGAAGIGGGGGIDSWIIGGGGGIITIGGNAQVSATGGKWGAGIGGGGGNNSSIGGGTIALGGNAQVTAAGGLAGAGIGGGNRSNTTPENNVITITGNAKVYAQGSQDGAGLGGGDGDNIVPSGAKITIGTGSDYPVVIAKSGATNTVQLNGLNTSAIGSGGVSDPTGSAVQIEIRSGFVVAKRTHDNAAGQDIGGAYGSGSYVKISGGSVYAASASVNPAPTNSGGGTAVFPLYAPATLGNKTISVANPAYTAKTISKTAARFLATGLFTSGTGQFPAAPVSDLTGLFPTALSGSLWLPAKTYTGITTNPASGTYGATVTAEIAPYTTGGGNRLMKE